MPSGRRAAGDELTPSPAPGLNREATDETAHRVEQRPWLKHHVDKPWLNRESLGPLAAREKSEEAKVIKGAELSHSWPHAKDPSKPWLYRKSATTRRTTPPRWSDRLASLERPSRAW